MQENFGPPAAGKGAASGRLRTGVRRAIISLIAQLLFPEIALEITPLESSMTTAAGSLQIVPQSPPSTPALRAADQGVADALESVLSDNTRRVYGAQWRLFNDWCDLVGLRALPAEPLTVARYLAVRAGSGASVATLRLATSAIARVHRWAGHESPGRDRGVQRSAAGLGASAGPAPASGRRPHRRRPRRHPAHRRPAP